MSGDLRARALALKEKLDTLAPLVDGMLPAPVRLVVWPLVKAVVQLQVDITTKIEELERGKS